MNDILNGFSKKSTQEKIEWVCTNFFQDPIRASEMLNKYRHTITKYQELHESFSENTISNFLLPYSLAPNFLINESLYCLPMVTEESSVVAAASNAAKFWFKRGGFHAQVIETIKEGQIHFIYKGEKNYLVAFIERNKANMLHATDTISSNMKKRDGGIQSIKLIDKTSSIANYYQLSVSFRTGNAMGANYINSCLEEVARTMQYLFSEELLSSKKKVDFEILMSILSNYTPECLVKVWVECRVEELSSDIEESLTYANRFELACKIAKKSVARAVTHNKGIMNGIDAILIATGNDFRAVEAGTHAYASKSGQYSGLSHASIINGNFKFELTVPLSIGTVGGVTTLHPLANWSMELLGNPDVKTLMEITASLGLAQNFGAINSLITSGIQRGHMKMHLNNILHQLRASEQKREKAKKHFANKKVNFQLVKEFINRS